ncbi:hypothetical protein BJ968_004128 [Kineococcus aurantiacus]|uniref:Uncharacterized protein n=1 Tax=Kineococcus aurantiacus TaxID=37633 RepID=A0A7Y9DPY6_9ACTN|nr:hypothetical protein [Kineococcus aurantiacus]
MHLVADDEHRAEEGRTSRSSGHHTILADDRPLRSVVTRFPSATMSA